MRAKRFLKMFEEQEIVEPENVEVGDLNSDEFDIGLKDEMEHRHVIEMLIRAYDPEVTDEDMEEKVVSTLSEIVRDHLKKDVKYYTKLSKMEADSEQE